MQREREWRERFLQSRARGAPLRFFALLHYSAVVTPTGVLKEFQIRALNGFTFSAPNTLIG